MSSNYFAETNGSFFNNKTICSQRYRKPKVRMASEEDCRNANARRRIEERRRQAEEAELLGCSFESLGDDWRTIHEPNT